MAEQKRVVTYSPAFTAQIVIAPTGSPKVTVECEPTITTTAASARIIRVAATFNGSGVGAAAMGVSAKHEPTANPGEVFAITYNCRANPPEGITIASMYAAFCRIVTEGTGKGTITKATSILAASPSLTGVNPTTIVGMGVQNQGAAGVTTSVGVDVEEQKNSTTTNIGVRIAKATTYALQLSDTGGTAAGGITFGTDTALWRSAAKVLKTAGRIEAEGGVGGIEAADVAGAWAAMTSLGAKVEKVAALQEPEARTEQATGSARLRGGVKVKALETLVAGETVCTLPEGKRPPKLVKIPTIVGTVTAGVLSIATTGVVTLDVNAAAGVEIYFDGVTFNLT